MMRASPKLIMRVNELFHDYEDNYAKDQKNMFLSEKKRWRSVFSKNLKRRNEADILEIGTGTGFVPLTLISMRTKTEIRYFCTDISEKILKRAENKIRGKNNLKFSFKKLSSEETRLPFPNSSMDIILMNSVLHHLPDANEFMREADRILRKDDVLIIGHEPNKLFFESSLLCLNYSVLSSLARMVVKIKNIGRRENESQMTRNINESIIREKLIKKPLSGSEIEALVDYKSMTGFDIFALGKNHGFVVDQYDSYNYLLNFSFNYGNPLFAAYEIVMKKIFRKRGGAFSAVLKRG